MQKLRNGMAGAGLVHVHLERHSNTLCGTSTLTLEDVGIDALVTCPRCLDSRNWTATMRGIQALVDNGGVLMERDGRHFVQSGSNRTNVTREAADAMRSVWAGRAALEVANG